MDDLPFSPVGWTKIAGKQILIYILSATIDTNSLEGNLVIYIRIINVYSILSRNFTSRLCPTNRAYVLKGICRYAFTTALLEIPKEAGINLNTHSLGTGSIN